MRAKTLLTCPLAWGERLHSVPLSHAFGRLCPEVPIWTSGLEVEAQCELRYSRAIDVRNGLPELG